jgi:hypothetical protein
MHDLPKEIWRMVDTAAYMWVEAVNSLVHAADATLA